MKQVNSSKYEYKGAPIILWGFGVAGASAAKGGGAAAAGSGAGGAAAGAGIAAATNVGMLGLGFIGMKRREKRADERQRKLMEIQQQNQMKLNEQGQALAMKTWNDTNYAAQVKHMEDAGLSVGMMYGQGGAGGATTNAGSGGSAAGGQVQQGKYLDVKQGADMGQMMMLGAQIEQMKAGTEKLKAETNKIAGVDTAEGESRISLNESGARLNLSKEEVNQSAIELNKSTMEVQSSVVKLNGILGNLNEQKVQESIAKTSIDNSTIKWMEETGLNVNDSVVAKSIQYMSSQTGMSPKAILLLIGGAKGLETLTKSFGNVMGGLGKEVFKKGAKTIKGFGG